MLLTTITHTGRRASYQALVEITYLTDTTARVRDETGLWEAIVQIDERLATRLAGGDMPAYFWARLRGGDIDLRDRATNVTWAGNN